jgi:hypothetical protein
MENPTSRDRRLRDEVKRRLTPQKSVCKENTKTGDEFVSCNENKAPWASPSRRLFGSPAAVLRAEIQLRVAREIQSPNFRRPCIDQLNKQSFVEKASLDGSTNRKSEDPEKSDQSTVTNIDVLPEQTGECTAQTEQRVEEAAQHCDANVLEISWDNDHELAEAVNHQFLINRDPDAIFQHSGHDCDLSTIFDRDSISYMKRYSTGEWSEDGLSIQEELVYKREIGLQDLSSLGSLGMP